MLKAVPADQVCIDDMKPSGLTTAWYKASVDVMNRYISGLLLVKELPDGVTRLVFTNEAGITYFDFSFDAAGNFTVNYVIRQLNKRPVITMLRKDFELWAGLPFRNKSIRTWAINDERFHGAMEKKNSAFFITNEACTTLHRLERGSERKRTLTVTLTGPSTEGPDSVLFQHHTFDMTIGLRRLERD